MTFYLERPLWRNKHHEVTRENLSEKDYRARLNKQRDIISVSETANRRTNTWFIFVEIPIKYSNHTGIAGSSLIK